MDNYIDQESIIDFESEFNPFADETQVQHGRQPFLNKNLLNSLDYSPLPV
jgi:hypothetical protein